MAHFSASISQRIDLKMTCKKRSGQFFGLTNTITSDRIRTFTLENFASMKALDKILNRFSRLNSGHDIGNRSTGTKLVVVIGMILVISLAVIGTIHLANN